MIGARIASGAMATALVLAGVLVSGEPASAKVYLHCKKEMRGGAKTSMSESETKQLAKSSWITTVTQFHGSYWADLSKAKGGHYKCADKPGVWQCAYYARPCAHTKPSRASKHFRVVPPGAMLRSGRARFRDGRSQFRRFSTSERRSRSGAISAPR